MTCLGSQKAKPKFPALKEMFGDGRGGAKQRARKVHISSDIF
jgi:hypothetical protein